MRDSERAQERASLINVAHGPLLVIRRYLEGRRTGPVFHTLVRQFALPAPTLLAASALREASPG